MLVNSNKSWQREESVVRYRLDAAKTQSERNRLGQFATPIELATDILKYATKLVSATQQIRFLDPAFGKGSFYAGLLRSFPLSRIEKAWGYEVDPQYGAEAVELWGNAPLELRIEDFTQAALPDSEDDKANLLICNPPYVRHHHLSAEDKSRLQSTADQITGLKLNGLTGLYCYFLLISHGWMKDGGLAGWLIPSEFMDVNYGQPVKEYLLQHVKLLHIHRFNPDEVQFEDALVSSAVVWFAKEKPPDDHNVRFSYGGTLLEPEMSDDVSLDALGQTAKWTRLPGISAKVSFPSVLKITQKGLRMSDLFRVKRGLATGANKFFILTPERIEKYGLPDEFLIPILPSPRYLSADEVQADDDGNPLLDQRLFLLNCYLLEKDIEAKYPHLWKYLQDGVRQGISRRHLCGHRSPWYSQEKRPPSPFLCTYMGRHSSGNSRPFRFILNHSSATASNVYLMLYPIPALEEELEGNPELLRAIWQALNDISADTLKAEGRIYGGGLYKIEPNELANTPADSVMAVLPKGVAGNGRG